MPNPIKIRTEVISHTKLVDGVYLLVLAPERKKYRFYPGQFLHLALDAFDPNGGFWPDSRVFSIASAPESGSIEILYSVKGSFTSRMEKQIQLHDVLWIKYPYGNFIIENFIHDNNTEIVVIAGGTGISPFLSFFRSSDHISFSNKISLYWGVKNPAIFNLLSTGDTMNDGRYDIHLYRESLDNNVIYPSSLGVIPIDDIYGMHGQNPNNVFFLSGPPSMVSKFKGFLLGKGIERENIIIDDWE
ncbi:FAD-dependent oxidoreductase [Sphaerochaeta sp.]|uniref:FAD-dependent oxidoreductase n=1 Tax=Sphaerochaeta sp. TaxID=1972642 RepID=UPI002FC782AB